MDDYHNLQKLYGAMQEILIGIDVQLTLASAFVFLYVAMHEGCTQKDIEHGTGITQSNVSRITRALSEYPRIRGRGGYQVLRMEADTEDKRYNCCFLTAKGARLIKAIERNL